nr:RHS repeat-associated core domain-containing protein [Lentimicrobium sp. S6]
MFNEAGEVLQDQSYYPFGMSLGNELTYQNTDDSPKNKYLYNGKELQMDFELDWYDYGARFYDAALGRFTTIDPLAEYAFNWTPYRFGYNNPIKYSDPSGLMEVVQTHQLGEYSGYLNTKEFAMYYKEQSDNADTLILLKEVEIVANNESNTLFSDGYVLYSKKAREFGGRKSQYDSKSIDLDALMEFLSWNPHGIPNLSDDLGMFLRSIYDKMIGAPENEEEPPVPVSDEKVKEETTGKGKVPEKDYHSKVDVLGRIYIKYYGHLDSNIMIGPIYYIDRETKDTLGGERYTNESWGPDPKAKK